MAYENFTSFYDVETQVHVPGYSGYITSTRGAGPFPYTDVVPSISIRCAGSYDWPNCGRACCIQGSDYSLTYVADIVAYDPSDSSKYAVCNSVHPTLAKEEISGSGEGYRKGYLKLPEQVISLPLTASAWDFYGGLSSLSKNLAIAIVVHREHFGTDLTDYVNVRMATGTDTWLQYEHTIISERYANSIDSYPIFADRSTKDANGDQIDTTYLKTANATGVKKITTSLPPVSTPVSELGFFTNGRVQCDSTDMGLLAPYPGQADSGKILQATWTGSPAVGSATWVDKPDILKRNNAELYFHHTGDGDAYHVRKIKNNAMNHVTVSNHSGDICSLTIEAPTLGTDEEQNYYVVFDCYSSSGSCGVDVENASPRLLTNIELNASSTYLKTNLANSASDAVTPEATVKDSNGDNKYLRIDSASYYGGVTETTTLAGPLVLTGATIANSTMTNTSVGFSGSPTYMIHVIGGMWELYSF